MGNYKNYLSPIKIGNLELRNRGVMPAMVTNFCNPDGSITDRFIAYHEARAKGGVGLIIIEAAYINRVGKGFINQIAIDSDALIPRLKELTERVHQHGAKMAIQIHHAGREADANVTGMQVIAPSPIPCPVMQSMPRELSIDEIKTVVEEYAQAAIRAKKAGFDAIEIHGTHGYIINQFLSPHTNHRTDIYGGSLENRMRFPLEVIDTIRKSVGEDFPVIYRIASDEYLPDGLTVKDAVAFSKVLVEHSINAIHVSGGTYATGRSASTSDDVLGVYVENAAQIKEAINSAIPVIVANRIKTPDFAEEVIASGKADMISTGRALLCDPDYFNKILTGREDEIRTCLSCNHCISMLFSGNPISCIYNPLTGNELNYDLSQPTQEKKKVLVIGGGPSGMTAANIAAMKGHTVALYEKNAYLGGNVIPGSRPPYKSELLASIDYLSHALVRNKVKVYLNTECTIDTISSEKPDVVLVACGSTPVIPRIPGAENDYVFSAKDILFNNQLTGKKVIVIGGGSVGMETAELLATQNKEVSLIEMADDVLLDMDASLRAALMDRVNNLKVGISTGQKVLEIKNHFVVTDKQTFEDIDTVIVAVGYKAEDSIIPQLQEASVNYQVIGDAVKPRRIYQAVKEGFEAAYNL